MRIVLISHCNFLGNSAMHVFSMAQMLRGLHHDVVMLVPDGLETLARHRPPSFPVCLYQQALDNGLPFASEGKADIIHAWTPRERVRLITEHLVLSEGCPYILHMEDNEEQIVTDELLNANFQGISGLPTPYQDALTPDYRSHPTRYKSFISGARGFTCLTEKLLEFKPSHMPGVVFWAGFDPEFEHLPPDAREHRARYGILADDIVIFYSGNVHNSNVADVRNLYLAVAALRARGRKVRLVRTGWDQAEIDIRHDPIASESYIELGFVDRDIVPYLVGMSDILVQPGRSDTFNDYRFPSKLPEYLVSAKPVILPACNIGNALDDGGQVIKLYDGSLAELICAIEKLLDDPSLGYCLGQKGREFALAHLSWTRAAQIASDFYEHVSAIPARTANILSLHAQAKAQAPASQTHPVNLIGFVHRRSAPLSGRSLPSDFRTINEQARLAKSYGLSGFCFFAQGCEARTILEFSFKAWTAAGADFPFCLCWTNRSERSARASSSATRAITEEYAPGFEHRFMAIIAHSLCDTLYIKVDGAPILLLDITEELADPARSVAALRSGAANHGIPRLHIILVQSPDHGDPRIFGCNAAVEAPLYRGNQVNLHHADSDGIDRDVANYVGVANNSINTKPTDYICYRTCCPLPDQPFAKQQSGLREYPKSLATYGRWLRFLVEEAMTRRNDVEPLLFLNFWNQTFDPSTLKSRKTSEHSVLKATEIALVHGVSDYIQGRNNSEREDRYANAIAQLDG